MSTMLEVISVLTAASQAVAKVFVIGFVGYAAVCFPKKGPYLPAKAVTTLAHFSFHVLVLPLFYSNAAAAVEPSAIVDYWFVFLGSFFVIGVSYAAATVLSYPFPVREYSRDFTALRVAATYPSIIALPILIFPSLCENEVVYRKIARVNTKDECVTESNTMLFCYFFSWSLAFWSLGYPALMTAAENAASAASASLERSNTDVIHEEEEEEDEEEEEEEEDEDGNEDHDEEDLFQTLERTRRDRGGDRGGLYDDEDDMFSLNARNNSSYEEIEFEDDLFLEVRRPPPPQPKRKKKKGVGRRPSAAVNQVAIAVAAAQSPPPLWKNIFNGFKQTFTSPGFLALLAGFLTACVPPLQGAMFKPGGALRFLGDSLETLGQAATPLSTLLVAASLARGPKPPSLEDSTNNRNRGGGNTNNNNNTGETASSTRSNPNGNGDDQSQNHQAAATSGRHSADASYDDSEQPSSSGLGSHGGSGSGGGGSGGDMRVHGRTENGRRAPPRTTSSGGSSSATFRQNGGRARYNDSPNSGGGGGTARNTGGTARQDQDSPSHDTVPRRYLGYMRESFCNVSDPQWRQETRRHWMSGPSHKMKQLLKWFSMSRLIVAPSCVTLMIVLLDTSRILPSDVPPLSKLVLIVNSCMPGANIIVVALKSKEELADSANAVAKIYLPVYVFCIFTIAAWTAIGLWVSIPNENAVGSNDDFYFYNS